MKPEINRSTHENIEAEERFEKIVERCLATLQGPNRPNAEAKLLILDMLHVLAARSGSTAARGLKAEAERNPELHYG